jgi:PQQ-like domain
VRTLWSQTVSSSLRGLSAARERGWLLVWDAHQNLYLVNHAGERQAQIRPPDDLVAACAADDGRSFVAVGKQGQLSLLAPDLTPRWQRSIERRATAVAVDGFGRRIAVAGADGSLHLYDDSGQLLWTNSSPRPLHFISFIPEKPALVAAADFGLILCYDGAGRCLWRDALVAHLGSLTTSGDGAKIVVACYSEGALAYSLVNGPKARRQVGTVVACQLLASSYAGDVIVTVGLDSTLSLRTADGTLRAEARVDGRPVGMVVNALGTQAIVATAEGMVIAFDLGGN